MKVLLFLIFMSLLYPAQLQLDKNILLQKSYDNLVKDPKKAEETARYMLQNFSDKKSLNQSKFILVKSLYYQNDLSRMLDEITTDKPSFDTDNYTLFSSIVYSLGIHQGYYFSEDKKINIINSFENLYSLLERRNYQASKFVIQNLISKTNIRNKQSLREFWLMTFDNIPQANILFFKNEIKNVIKLFSDDEEFELLSVKLSITEKNNQIAKNILYKLGNDPLQNSSNLRLKRRYYDVLSQFFLNENAKEKYIENKEKRNTITREIDSEITKGRSLWFAYTQKNNKESIENTRYKAKIFLYSLCFIFLVFFIFGFIWLRQLRAKEKQYQLFQQKINSLTEKKQVQNIISEKTENLLLTKLNKFELTTDFLNPNISLQSLAKKLDTNTKYLSETINTHKQKNFNAYINELRINYILLKLKDETIYRNYKIGYLAEECGFSSHSLFTSVFKSVTGMSPMTYIKFLSEKEE